MSAAGSFGTQVGAAGGEIAGEWLKSQVVPALAGPAASLPSQAVEEQASAEGWKTWGGYAWPIGAVVGGLAAVVTIAALRKK